MRFAITGTDARFLPLRKLLLADGHEITDPASADMVISPPGDPSARYARREEYQIAIARLTAGGALGQGAPAGGAADEEDARSTACPRFPSPVLGEEARALYARLYGGNGRRFADILDTSPDEIAVVSRLIAYLAQREEG